MLFAVGKEINVVTFKIKNNDFDKKTFKDEGWNLYQVGHYSWKLLE